MGEIRVIHRFRAMGAKVIEAQPLGLQGGDQRLFQRQAGMVGRDGDGHGRDSVSREKSL